MIFRLILFLPLSVLFCLGLDAASTDGGYVAGTTPPLRFRTLGIGVDAENFFYLDGQKTKPFIVNSDRRSVYYDYTTPSAPISFVKIIKTADGKDQREVIAQAVVDPSLRRALLVFIKGSTENSFKILPLKDDISAVPPGGYRVLNFLSVSAGILVGKEKQIIAPGTSSVIDPRALPNTDIYPFKVFGLTSNAAIPVFSNIFSIDKQTRHLVLIVPTSEGATKVDVKFLGESVNAILPDDPPPLRAGAR